VKVTPLGRIARLQVQRDTVKRKGEGYDATPILAVDEAAIGPLGIVGRHDDAWVVDVHHRAHPSGKGGGRRALSIGFTSHYDRILERFGSAPVGCAGENVIVEVDRVIGLDDLSGEVVIVSDGGEVSLTGARVATPCLEFTSFLLGRSEVAPRVEIADDVAFLDGGTRGYILDVAHLERPMRVRVGDQVMVRR
jgi:hypothetical protein